MQAEIVKRWQDIAARQHGLISREQALESRLTPGQIRGWLARGSLIRVLPAVYRVAAAPQTWRQPLMAACLWAAKGKAAIFGQSAAAVWEFQGYWRTRVELCGLSSLSPPRGVVFHQVK